LRRAIYKPRPCLTRSHSNPAFQDWNPGSNPKAFKSALPTRTEAAQSNDQSRSAQGIF
jgi:hypothetical protein